MGSGYDIGTVYITFSKYLQAMNKHDSVYSVDINLDYHVYGEIMNDPSLKDFLSHYFLVTTNGEVIWHKLIAKQNFQETLFDI